MIPITETKVCQIEITNNCHLSCANCTRFVGHHAHGFMMSEEDFANALDSLEGYPGHVGIMGGEPALHPQFPRFLEILREKVPEKGRREFWTAGYKWDEYKDDINNTFNEELIAYNDHSEPEEGWHQPLLIAIEEVFENKEIMWKHVNNCWVQLRWSPSITTKGVFFCEVAAAMDHLFNGPGGWKVEKGWWKRKPSDPDFQEQVKRYCGKCSACLPLPMIPNNHEAKDWISPGNFERLKAVNSPKLSQGRYEVVDVAPLREYVSKSTGEPGGDRGGFKDFPEWTPWNYRSAVYHAPGEGKLNAQEVRALQYGRVLRAMK